MLRENFSLQGKLILRERLMLREVDCLGEVDAVGQVGFRQKMILMEQLFIR